MTLFLNCALRLSELVSLTVEQVGNDVLTINGKGNKERKIFLTPAAKKSLTKWLMIRRELNLETNALFISRCRSPSFSEQNPRPVDKKISTGHKGCGEFWVIKIYLFTSLKHSTYYVYSSVNKFFC